MHTVKFVVENLNKTPFNKHFNVISFDSLVREDLLQILSDVLQEISEQDKTDIHLEDFDDTIARIFNSLLIFKYKPFLDSLSTFRANLIQGDKNTIYALLEWLFMNVDELKKRAYLSRFLIKIDVPTDILGDTDIATLHQQYIQLLDEFKNVHRESVFARDVNKISVSELRSDGVTMEKEKEIVSNRIYSIKKKIDNLPNIATLLRSCCELRVEYDRKKEISWQLKDEMVTTQQSQQRLFRLSQQLQELKKRSVDLSPQALLKKLEEEIYVTSYIANQKLPRELLQQKTEKEILDRIVYSNTAITKAANETLSVKIQSASLHINKLLENRLSSNVADDKTILYRQQAAIIARKKDTFVEKFSQLKNQLQDVYSKVRDKQQTLESILGENGTFLKNKDNYKEYVSKLRTRSSIYKRYRSDFASLKAECGVLRRTLDILNNKIKQFGVNLSETQQFDEKEDDVEAYNNDSLLSLITQVTSGIGFQKTKLTPIINRVKSLQEEIRYLKSEHEEKKRVYDRTNVSLNTNLTKLVNDVNQLEEEHTNSVMATTLTESNVHIAKVNLQRAKEEFQASIDKNNSAPSIKEKLNHKITECDKISKLLKDEQKHIQDNEKKCVYQRELWNNLKVLMRLKIKYLEREKEEFKNVMHLEKDGETLVLSGM